MWLKVTVGHDDSMLTDYFCFASHCQSVLTVDNANERCCAGWW